MLLLADWIALTGCLLLGAFITWSVYRRERWLQALGYLLAVLVWAVHLLDAWLDYIWVWLVPHPASTTLMLCAVWPALIAVVLGLIQYIRQPRDRRALYLLAGLLVLYAGYTLVRQLVSPGVSPQSWWAGETLMQSTGSTCVAAAAATYLRTEGVTLTEAEAARRGMISAAGGTQTQAWRILRLSLPANYRIRIGPVDRAGFGDHCWRVVSIRYSSLEGHAVVARLLDGAQVLIRDPLAGEYTMAWDEFSRSYLGVGVWAEQVGAARRPVAEEG